MLEIVKGCKMCLLVLPLIHNKFTMAKSYISFLFTLFVFHSFSQLYTVGAGVSDVDGNNYPTIDINGQEWMAENLRTTKYSNGDSIPNKEVGLDWVHLTNGSWVWYNNDSSYEQPYGKLYNFFSVEDSRGLCPSGWRVPSQQDFDLLINTIGGYSGTSMKLKVTEDSYWSYTSIMGDTVYNNGTNTSGFSGVPSGFRYGMSSQPNDPGNGPFATLGYYLNLWTTTPALNSPVTDNSGNGFVWVFLLRADSDNILTYEDQKESGHSIRCMRESVAGLNNIKPNNKKLIKVIDLMGRETQIIPNQVLIYLFDDGSTEKFIQIQE